MRQATVSFRKGKGNINHNNRKFLTNNVDVDRVKENIIYIQKDLKQLYKDIFQSSVDEYNAKQKRADRKIKSYYDKIENSKQEKLFYEVIVQIGDKDFTDKTNAQRILNDYMGEFEKRNPTLKVFNAIMHNDETTPHLHIDFVPVATGYKKGLSKRNSLSRALNGDLNSWYEKEREFIKDLAKMRNIEIIKKNEPKRAYMAVEEYKTYKESVKHVLEAFKSNLRYIEDMNNGFGTYNKNYSNTEQKISDTIKSHATYHKGLFGKASYSIPENKLYDLVGTLLRQSLAKDYEVFEDKAKSLISDIDENKLIQNIHNNQDLFRRINKIEEENKKLKKMEKEYKALKTEFNIAKNNLEKSIEEKYREKYKNEIDELNKYLSLYKNKYSNLRSEYDKYGLAKVVYDKKQLENKNIKFNKKELEI